jgi:SOS-response transcriptional repressor LexA
LSYVNSDAATVYLRQLIEEEHAEAIAEWEKSPQEKTTNWGIEEKSHNGSIGVFPIFGKIPAGNPRPISQFVTDYVEVEQFIIEDKAYRVVGGHRDKFRLNFSLEWNYITLRVDGDSMNNAGLDDGDYVILRVSAIIGTDPIPNSGDIVAVALPETDAVTLKRFRRKSDQVIFEPDSTNPAHSAYPFKITGVTNNMPFKIVGIHVATLKPV